MGRGRTNAVFFFGLAATLSLTGCSDDTNTLPPLAVPEGCQPLAGDGDCLLPYPSDFFLVEDASTASGHRVELSDAAQLRDEDGNIIDFLAEHPADGFSLGNQILALFPEGLSGEGLVDATVDPERSLDDDSQTVLIDATTGERILHLAELDPRPREDHLRALIIRPLQRLDPATRYVVALRNLTLVSGARAEAPEGFRRLRDQVAGDDPALQPLARYETDVFAPLEGAGIPRDNLQLAWDFTTRSADDARRDMLSMRRNLLAHLQASPPKVTIVSVEETDVDAEVFRRIEATVTVPLFMDTPEPFARVNHDGDGEVVARGTVEVPFTVLIPASVAARPAGSPPVRVMQFGHGFFGNRHEILGDIDEVGDGWGYIVVAADWWGMMEDDRTVLAESLGTDPKAALGFIDRVHQGMANFITLSEAVRTVLPTLPELEVDGQNVVGDELYFYGISQGAILGGTFMGLTPHISKAAFSVGGADFSMMMFRAAPFIPFLALIGAHMDNRLDEQKFAMLSQTTFDRIDPLTYADLVLESPLEDGPASRQLLFQMGIGDALVPNLGSHFYARSLRLPLLSPAPRAVTGFVETEGPLQSALVEYDFGVSPLPGLTATPPSMANEVHGGLRRLDRANDQLDAFFQMNGGVTNACDGVCDPE